MKVKYPKVGTLYRHRLVADVPIEAPYFIDGDASKPSEREGEAVLVVGVKTEKLNENAGSEQIHVDVVRLDGVRYRSSYVHRVNLSVRTMYWSDWWEEVES
jgi:hypothetical protein